MEQKATTKAKKIRPPWCAEVTLLFFFCHIVYLQASVRGTKGEKIDFRKVCRIINSSGLNIFFRLLLSYPTVIHLYPRGEESDYIHSSFIFLSYSLPRSLSIIRGTKEVMNYFRKNTKTSIDFWMCRH